VVFEFERFFGRFVGCVSRAAGELGTVGTDALALVGPNARFTGVPSAALRAAQQAIAHRPLASLLAGEARISQRRRNAAQLE